MGCRFDSGVSNNSLSDLRGAFDEMGGGVAVVAAPRPRFRFVPRRGGRTLFTGILRSPVQIRPSTKVGVAQPGRAEDKGKKPDGLVRTDTMLTDFGPVTFTGRAYMLFKTLAVLVRIQPPVCLRG
jgi:hypothetical protein